MDSITEDISHKLQTPSSVNNDVENNAEPVEKLLFFNYHEISIDDYELIPGSTVPKKPLIITHFPNPYNTETNTRIVRIPRTYTSSKDDAIPVFCNVLPGYEELLIIEPISANSVLEKGEDKKFLIRGSINNQFYGFSSVSPLSNHLTPTELAAIINRINELLEESYGLLQFWFIIWTILDFLLISIPSLVQLDKLPMWDKGRYNAVERYIEELNSQGICHERNIKIISPRKSGFLSLDFEIPTPTL